MNATIIEASITHSKSDGYVGRVVFAYAGHKSDYELMLQSKDAKDWAYSLNFNGDNGIEAEIEALEEQLEEDDELFDFLVDAAKAKL